MYYVLSWIIKVIYYCSSELDTDSHRNLGLKRQMVNLKLITLLLFNSLTVSHSLFQFFCRQLKKKNTFKKVKENAELPVALLKKEKKHKKEIADFKTQVP